MYLYLCSRKSLTMSSGICRKCITFPVRENCEIPEIVPLISFGAMLIVRLSYHVRYCNVDGGQVALDALGAEHFHSCSSEELSN